jgi:hypothetical protein
VHCRRCQSPATSFFVAPLLALWNAHKSTEHGQGLGGDDAICPALLGPAAQASCPGVIRILALRSSASCSNSGVQLDGAIFSSAATISMTLIAGPAPESPYVGAVRGTIWRSDDLGRAVGRYALQTRCVLWSVGG